MAETVEYYQNLVAENPYDVHNWDGLIYSVKNGPASNEQTAKLREIYENIVSIFPTACAYWREYCEFEIQFGTEESVKSLFGKCLLLCLDVELWKVYLNYIRTLNSAEDPQGAVELKNSLEFAIDHIGQDIYAGSIWLEYVEFLSGVKENTPVYESVFGKASEGQQEAAKTASIRRALHRAIAVPNMMLDELWTFYERFENSLGNKTLAKRSLDEWRPKYHASKMAFKERQPVVEALDTRMLPSPPGKGGYYQMESANKWRSYYQYERDNQGESDDATYQARVVLAYEQSLSRLIHFPDVWLDYASWHAHGKGNGNESAVSVLNRGREALPVAVVLHFTAADLEESSGNVERARVIYEELISAPVNDTSGAEADDTEENKDGNLSPELKTLAWIQYMRFVRRCDGLMAARKLFLRARKWSGLQWQAFVASARFEWANDGKDHIPRNIFELGLKSFLKIPGYVLEYASFLQGIGDMANARALYERALTAIPPEDSGPIWDGYIAFEAECGPLSTVYTLESRRREALKSEANDSLDPLHVALLKYKFADLVPGEQDMFDVAPEYYAEEYYDTQHYEEKDGEYQTDAYQQQVVTTGHGRKHPTPRIPRNLHHLMKQLSGPADGMVPTIEQILEPILQFDFSNEGIEAHEAQIQRSRRRKGPRRGGRKAGTTGTKRKSVAGEEQGNSDDGEEEEEEEALDEDITGGMDVYRQRMMAKP